ncbi:hypothetical protein [Tamlana flava]|uniref:hypothetical protein n=1 Tax=Tamlana flava TaxID=3158572 RepID=UPI00351BC8DB
MNSLVLFGLLLIIVLIIAIQNLILIKRRKKKFDFIPLVLFLFFGVLWYFLVEMPYKKFWTQKTMVGFVEKEGTPKSGTLVLFKNGSFGASYHHADYSCTYQGDYEIIDNQLILKRTDIMELTDSIFTTKYLINRKNGVLKPTENEFLKIEISKIIE